MTIKCDCGCFTKLFNYQAERIVISTQNPPERPFLFFPIGLLLPTTGTLSEQKIMMMTDQKQKQKKRTENLKRKFQLRENQIKSSSRLRKHESSELSN